MSAREPLRVALHTSVMADMDAISWTTRLKIGALEALSAQGHPTEWMLFTTSADFSSAQIACCARPREVISNAFFDRADLHVYDFGIYFDLLNSVYFRRRNSAALGAFHNITPPRLATSLAQRWLLERSTAQLGTLMFVDHVMCDSDFNRDELVAAGYDVSNTSVVNLPFRILGPADPVEGAPRDIDILFVGRLVEQKGIRDLADAIRLLEPPMPIRVAFAGNPTFSDPATLDYLRGLGEWSPAIQMELHLAPTDSDLARLYSRTRVFAMPSHHEGYCVPVLEALGAGCFVVASDAGNLPAIVGNCGYIVPVGDHRALSSALGHALDIPGVDSMPLRRVSAVPGPRDPTRPALVSAHLSSFSEETFRQGFFRAMASALQAAGRGEFALELACVAGAITQ